MSLLEVEALTAGYHGGTVLHEVDLSAAPGRITAVVGHNGAGKSTLMQAIAGLLPAGGGAVRWDDRAVTAWPVHRRARAGIGYVPQGRRVFGSVTVAEHLAISQRRGSDWTAERVCELFPRLAQRWRSKGGQLSGGEQQMLAIARALLTGPRVLLLDEPTEGLAPVIVDLIQSTVSELAEAGMGIVLAAPQPRWPVKVADDLCVLDNGRISKRFSGDEVRADDAELYAALALDSSGMSTEAKRAVGRSSDEPGATVALRRYVVRPRLFAPRRGRRLRAADPQRRKPRHRRHLAGHRPYRHRDPETGHATGRRNGSVGRWQ